MSKFAYILFILIIIAALAVVLMAALIADTDTAGAADACWHGCPKPPLRPQIYMPIVNQCRGVYCDYGGWLNEVTK
jgi:hypothetical protein